MIKLPQQYWPHRDYESNFERVNDKPYSGYASIFFLFQLYFKNVKPMENLISWQSVHTLKLQVIQRLARVLGNYRYKPQRTFALAG